VKVVVDTNTLVSGLIWGGRPGVLIEWVISERIEMYASEIIMHEYFRIIEKLSKNNHHLVNQWKMFLLDTVTIIETNEKITDCSDPDDNMFLECAVASKSKLIISGDTHLLSMNPFRTIEIMKVGEFLNKFE
jgi:putative PIN family toxin of toxin-antitoxin system